MLAAGGWGWLVVNGKGRCQSCQASSHASCQITSYKPAFSLENCAWYFTVFLSVGKVQLYLVNNSKLPDTHSAPTSSALYALYSLALYRRNWCLHAWSMQIIQNHCLVLFCILKTESKQKVKVIYSQNCSKSEQFEKWLRFGSIVR